MLSCKRSCHVNVVIDTLSIRSLTLWCQNQASLQEIKLPESVKKRLCSNYTSVKSQIHTIPRICEIIHSHFYSHKTDQDRQSELKLYLRISNTREEFFVVLLDKREVLAEN